MTPGAATPEPATAARPDPAAAVRPEPLVTAQPDPAVPVAARGRASRFFEQIPLALVICGVGVGLVVIALHHFRIGSVAIAVSVLGGAFFRLVLPTRQAGLLVVRSRFIDVATMVLIGGALLVLALVTRT